MAPPKFIKRATGNLLAFRYASTWASCTRFSIFTAFSSTTTLAHNQIQVMSSDGTIAMSYNE
jgi:hypothetical protein